MRTTKIAATENRMVFCSGSIYVGSRIVNSISFDCFTSYIYLDFKTLTLTLLFKLGNPKKENKKIKLIAIVGEKGRYAPKGNDDVIMDEWSDVEIDISRSGGKVS